MTRTSQEYLTAHGVSPFGRWFTRLNAEAATRVTSALYRLAAGHASAVKSVGQGVYEYRIDFGPGYRIYFATHGTQLIILLGGGSKQRQQHDIRLAIQRWRDYKHRARQSGH
jgi:putative addiction module killer protein